MNYERLGEVTDKFMAALAKRKELKGLFTFFASNYPQYEIVIDNDVAMQKGVSIADAMDNLSIVVGSTWEQGFVRFGQFYKVYVQASPEFRRYPEDLENMFVKNDKGEMVPYSAFMKLKKKQGLNEINRYNLYPSAAIQGAPATGYSSGQAIAAIKEVAAETLPRGFDIGWQGLSYDEANKGNTGDLYLLDRRHLRVSGSGRAIRELHPAAGGDHLAAGRDVRILPVPARPWGWPTTSTPRSVWSCWSVCWARTRF